MLESALTLGLSGRGPRQLGEIALGRRLFLLPLYSRGDLAVSPYKIGDFFLVENPGGLPALLAAAETARY